MKLYNPLKEHIVQAGDKYFVRKLIFLTWVYKSRNGHRSGEPIWWFIWEYAMKYCECLSLEEARALRDKKWIDPDKTPKVKVIHG